MRVERFVHGGNVYEPCGEGRSWLDFSANINPLGLAEHVRKIGRASCRERV